MFNLQQEHFIIYILFAMHIVWYGVAGGWLLFRHKQQHDRSRIFISCYFLYLALGSCNFILTALLRDDPTKFLGTNLEPYPLILSFLANMLTIAYLIEVLHPRWLTIKRFVLGVLPWLVLSLVWIIYHGMNSFAYDAITHLSDIHQILPNIDRTDVQIRVLILGLNLLYVLLVPFIRYNWRTCNVVAARITWLKTLVILCIIGFVLGMGLRIHVAILCYLGLLDMLTISVFMIEMRNRIPLPITPSPINLHPSSHPETNAHTLSPLAKALQQQLALGIWQNSDLDRDDVCQLLGTNRTYVASAIQELGYANFSEMINQQRIKSMHDELLQNPKADLSDVIYRAGFRNRTTAINYFKQVYNCKPADLHK